MRKFHEINCYLISVEQLIQDLKAELDLTRNLLYRIWLQQQFDCLIIENKKPMPDSVEFQTKKVGKKKVLLTVHDSPGGKYEKINSQLLELGLGSGNKIQELSVQLIQSRSVYKHIEKFIGNLPYESFYIILLDNSMRLIKTVSISEGGITGTMGDIRKVFKIALDNYTSNLILSHNHPSGNLQPSDCDKKLTKQIVEAGKLLDINVIDHLIIGKNGYFSFADEGIM